jgi:prevent-host-death family protein
VHEVGAFEAQNTLEALLDRVERGEEIAITRHGKPVARLIASGTTVDGERAKAAAARVRGRAKRLALDAFDWQALKVDRDERRP